MRRRTLLVSAAATLAAPAIARGAGSNVLTFVPQADLAVLDPIWTTTYQTRDHGFLVFDTLFGLDSRYQPSPQMAEGATSDDAGKSWRITLRSGLTFHDGSKVVARDCVASIRRWGARDGFGQALLAACDEVGAPDDRTVLFRLKYPFALLPDALAKTPPSMCPIMPERLAVTDPYKQVTEMVAVGRIGIFRTSACPARAWSMSETPYMCRGAAAHLMAPPARSWHISNVSSGASSLTPAPSRPQCRTARSTGG